MDVIIDAHFLISYNLIPNHSLSISNRITPSPPICSQSIPSLAKSNGYGYQENPK